MLLIIEDTRFDADLLKLLLDAQLVANRSTHVLYCPDTSTGVQNPVNHNVDSRQRPGCLHLRRRCFCLQTVLGWEGCYGMCSHY